MEQFDENKDRKISWEEFSKAMALIKGSCVWNWHLPIEQVNEKAKKSTHYKSYEQYFYDRIKHKYAFFLKSET